MRWTRAELAHLTSLRGAGLSWAGIAAELNRSVDACKARARGRSEWSREEVERFRGYARECRRGNITMDQVVLGMHTKTRRECERAMKRYGSRPPSYPAYTPEELYILQTQGWEACSERYLHRSPAAWRKKERRLAQHE